MALAGVSTACPGCGTVNVPRRQELQSRENRGSITGSWKLPVTAVRGASQARLNSVLKRHKDSGRSFLSSIQSISPTRPQLAKCSQSAAKSRTRRQEFATRVVCQAAGASAKLVTFLGKGGSGKTTAAVLLAKAFAAQGKRTVLVVQGQDRVAETLLDYKLPTIPEPDPATSNLSVVRLEATKLLLEPLAQLKKLDARLGFSSGALQEVVGEELSILPSMDTLLAAGALERLANVTGVLNRQPTGTAWDSAGKYDVVVYDPPSNQDILRLFGAADKTRWYLSRFRRLAEKTDAGRVLLPSVARAVDSVINNNSSGEASSTSQVWGSVDRVLDGAAQYFASPAKFTAFLVAKEGSKADHATALRLWGCAAQAGLFVGGLLQSPSGQAASPLEEFAPLKSVTLPKAGEPVGAGVGALGGEVESLVSGAAMLSPEPKIDQSAGTITLFLPGLEKSEIKLSQYQKGAELLVEAGDQRRSIEVPQGMRGKVVGAKFSKGYLTVTLRQEAAKI